MAEAPDFEGVLRCLTEAKVRFILIGGLAMIAHGAANLTVDVDCLYARAPENIDHLVNAFRPIHPKLRTPRESVPLVWESDFFKNVLNVTLTTDLGPVDLLAEAPGVANFDELWQRSQEMQLFGLPIRVASLDDLIEMKRAARRPKDLEHLMQLQALKKLLSERKT